jgi:glycogen phosphorylase
VNQQASLGVTLSPERFTIGFARRATAYKRPDLLLAEPERLRAIARKHGPIQVVYAGKAHPYDREGADLIHRIIVGLRELAPEVIGVYLPDYDMAVARRLVSGVDLWLNTPLPPLEASGTSGMKAALNGIPSLSTLDGWWVEGHVEGVTGWGIGEGTAPAGAGAAPGSPGAADRRASDADSIYEKLGEAILPLYTKDPAGWGQVMRYAIALNGSFFNAQRMLAEYAMKAYFL